MLTELLDGLEEAWPQRTRLFVSSLAAKFTFSAYTAKQSRAVNDAIDKLGEDDNEGDVPVGPNVPIVPNDPNVPDDPMDRMGPNDPIDPIDPIVPLDPLDPLELNWGLGPIRLATSEAANEAAAEYKLTSKSSNKITGHFRNSPLFPLSLPRFPDSIALFRVSALFVFFLVRSRWLCVASCSDVTTLASSWSALFTSSTRNPSASDAAYANDVLPWLP